MAKKRLKLPDLDQKSSLAFNRIKESKVPKILGQAMNCSTYEGGPAACAAFSLDDDLGSLHETGPDVVVHQWGGELGVIAATVPEGKQDHY